VARSIGIAGRFIALAFLAVLSAAPLAAEEITVTVPPDEPAAQQPSDSTVPSFVPPAPENDPTAHATDGAPAAEPAPQTTAAAPAEPMAAPSPAADAQPAQPVTHKTKKKMAATPVAAQTTADVSADAAVPAKPVKKAKAKSVCLNLAEEACGSNTACVWVAAGTDDAGKPMKARCRSMAMLKKEIEKAAKAGAGKTDGAEVLPWAANGAAPSSTASQTTTGSVNKPAKKTAHVAKKAKPKPEAASADTSAAQPGGADAGAPAAAGAPEASGAD
jgi:hypothetical protein